jgi:perosamine synthetase
METIGEFARAHGLKVVEDCAQSHGARLGKQMTGTFGDAGCFSFYPTKNLGALGDGGAIVTNDADLFERVLTLSNHGRARGQTKQFWPDLVGFKYKMSNLQAAIGCAQIERIDDLIDRKRQILAYYKDRLARLTCISLNPEPEGVVNGAWMPTVVFSEESGISRDKLQKAFINENVDARVFFWPLSSLTMFNSIMDNKNSWNIPNRAINLPGYHDILDQDLERVAKVLIDLSREFEEV